MIFHEGKIYLQCASLTGQKQAEKYLIGFFSFMQNSKLFMKKPLAIIGLLLVPIALVLAGLYYNQDILLSIGCILFIFFIIMAIRGKFTDQRKKDPQ